MTMAGKLPRSHALASLLVFRKLLDAASPHPSSIALDEWALGPPWSTQRFGLPHAIYGASLLSLITRHAQQLRLTSANYYEPINEGAITVGPWNSTLTPLGHVFELLSRHQDGRLVTLSEEWGHRADDDIECLASVGNTETSPSWPDGVDNDGIKRAREDGEGAVLLLTAINRNALAARSLKIRVTGIETRLRTLPKAISVECCILRGVAFEPSVSNRIGELGRFVRRRRSAKATLEPAGAAQAPDGKWRRPGARHGIVADSREVTATLRIEIPAYSIMQLAMPTVILTDS
eukprot:CAMPEP_0181175462 /NCGR_PEP_ID=MMETSP1096-20121128/4092_1 /TAXON_ID=156174 ORGANISM="Chrysochromulina ericina, Strain CCMP281" /NCGR_SAMPLE_ID=MMETSP1096 /ASSEMBLY_ACC=CAM_ASM_000453 /LENGTH=290 /DNA_ID=CAMNT_0023263451 /DNA_START=40 /DNA_END=912 /DNA_ORIENTATION=-